MAKTKILRNVQDVADYLGANEATEESISRRIYKDTECGAWAKVQGPTDWPAGKRSEAWIATFEKSVVGYVCIKLRKEHGLVFQPQEYAKVPQEVRDYFTLKQSQTNPIVWTFDAPEDEPNYLEALKPGDEIVSVRRRMIYDQPKAKLTQSVIVKAKVPVTRTRKVAGVFTIGSIVEGSDAEVPPVEITLPCRADEIDNAIKDVEFEADRLWREANEDETQRA